MPVNWEDLKKLLPYIKAWAEENQQFKTELLKIFNSPSSATTLEKETKEFGKSDINELINHVGEIKRTSYFLKAIDKNFSNEAKIFYKFYQVRNKNLLVTLCKDFKLMRIAETENEIIDYARYLILQLENVLNFIISKIDAYTIIQNSPEKFIDGRNNLLEGKYSFFTLEARGDNRQWSKNGRTYFEKDYTDLDITVKMNFVRMHYGFGYDYNIFREMNFLRNKASHRGEKAADMEKIAQIKAIPLNIAKSNYMNCFKTILNGIKDLNLE